MTRTNSTLNRRRRIIAAALALPLSLAMTGTAFASGGGDSSKSGKASASEHKPEKAEKAEKADKGASDSKAEMRSETKSETQPSAKSASKPATSSSKPAKSASKPATSSSKPAKSASKPASSKPAKSASKPAKSSSKPAKSASKPAKSSSKCITYSFVYNEGNKVDAGTFCGGNTVTRADKSDLNAVSLHISCSDTFVNGTAVKSDLGGLTIKTWSIDKGNGKTCGGTPSGPAPTTCPDGSSMPAGGDADDCKKDKKDKKDKSPKKLLICHATGSATNPYVLITPSVAGVANGHYGVGHQGGRDIIPAFTYKGVSYPAQGNQALLGTGCVAPGSTVTDVCPNVEGMQGPGTNCNPPTGGGGGGGSFDNCPAMPGPQPANFVCTKGSPKPTPPGKPIGGVTPPQGGSNPLPGVVPNNNNGPAVVSLPPAARPQVRAVPSALPFTGTDAALLAEFGVLLLVAGVGVVAVARRERTARAAA